MSRNFNDNHRKHLAVCNERFRRYCQSYEKHLLSEDDKLRMLVDGRYITNALLETYKISSKISLLIDFVELSCIISALYPTITSKDDLSRSELFTVKDKFKFYGQLIYALFQLNRLDLAEKEIVAYKNHLDIFGHKLEKYHEFRQVYDKMKGILLSFKCVHIYSDSKPRINIYLRNGLQPYEEIGAASWEAKKLDRAIIIGSCGIQVNYKNMSIDMFRMSQAIEYSDKESKTQRKNTRKWTFFDTPFWDVEIGMTDALHSIANNGIMLIYISGDMYRNRIKTPRTKNSLYRVGIKMKQEYDENIEHSRVECLYPGDLVGSLVVPTVLIIDCECSQAFEELSRTAEEPFLCLLSPEIYPQFIEEFNIGKLFTLFLTSPQSAFCVICNKKKLPEVTWLELVRVLNDFMMTLSKIVEKWLRKHESNKLFHFMTDQICRSFLLRYLFCMVSLRLNNEFHDQPYYPRSNFTSLEKEILVNRQLQASIYKMAAIIGAKDNFPTSCDLSSSNESIDVEK